MSGNRAKVGRLTICPTPIGNSRDITLRTLDVLRDADVIACEDTRRTGLLLDHHGLRPSEARLVSLHEHNERERVPKLIRQMRAGEDVALLSDAGMPVISDPGFPLLRAAIAAGIEVRVLPGPSAVITALVASGMPPSSFRFTGFLPRGRGELRRLLGGALETIVAFESPRRLAATLEVLAELDPERPVAVCRELSKTHEQVLRGSAAELARRYADEDARGEIVLVIGPSALDGDRLGAQAALSALVRAGAKRRPAAKVVASLTGLSANALYEGEVEGELASDPPAKRDPSQTAERGRASSADSLRRQ
jgi:16S rRNA (cytidine1402-2'-O)-methyltransferase